VLLIDTHEPTDIEELLKQSVPVSRAPLNQTGMSDFYFGGADNRTRQFSRKQAGELLSSIDEAERQLRDYYPYADENYQLIEGIISPVPITKKHKSFSTVSTRMSAKPNTLFSYSVANNGFIYGERAHEVSESLLQAWLFRLQSVGIGIIWTTNYISTATTLATIYKNCQKPPEEHSTLQRYIKPRIVIQKFNPFVLALMSLSSAYKIGIGEDKALAISEDYGSILDLAMSNVDELCQIPGIGKKVAKKLLQAIGREV
jgi:hypothetical protein